MELVAGLSLKNLKPRVWDPASPYYLPELQAVMISYADFHRQRKQRQSAMEQSLHRYLGIPKHVRIYLDNGAFFFLDREGGVPREDYEAFVTHAKPDWYPIPQDFIPTPRMTDAEQLECLRRTMAMNNSYLADGFVPVVHICRRLDLYIAEVKKNTSLTTKARFALGGIVPNLLRMPKAMPYVDVLQNLRRTRTEMAGKHLHVFGLGGTATVHLAGIFDIDSFDSSGWRNRAARGIVQLPGHGDRMIANMGSWRGREPDDAEWALLKQCACPSCQQFGSGGLKSNGIDGFCNRATHNLWVLLQEGQSVLSHLADGTYSEWYLSHIHNAIYQTLLKNALGLLAMPQDSDMN